MIKHNQLHKIQATMMLKGKIKWVHLVHLLHQLKSPLLLKEFIMFLQRITRWIKSWVILLRVSKLDLALLHFVNIILFVSFLEPNRVDETLRDPDWVNTMHEELNNFTRNQVWDLVERAKNYNGSGTKWVFRNKQNEDGMVVRNKTRLVAQGFTLVLVTNDNGLWINNFI